MFSPPFATGALLAKKKQKPASAGFLLSIRF
jgi:hypothetical protein